MEYWDGRFYEMVALFVTFLLAIIFIKGLCSSVSQSSIAHKFNSLRMAVYLTLGPGCLGRALLSYVIFYYWKETYGAITWGKDVHVGHWVSWILLAIILIFDIIVMLLKLKYFFYPQYI
jgi:hypothetical protein